MPYDLKALQKDMEQVEKEIKVFKDMLLKLMERRIQLQALIEEAEKRIAAEKALKEGNAEQTIDIPSKYIQPEKASLPELAIKKNEIVEPEET